MSEFLDEEEFDAEGERRAVRRRINDEGYVPVQRNSYANRWMDGPGGSACRGEV